MTMPAGRSRRTIAPLAARPGAGRADPVGRPIAGGRPRRLLERQRRAEPGARRARQPRPRHECRRRLASPVRRRAARRDQGLAGRPRPVDLPRHALQGRVQQRARPARPGLPPELRAQPQVLRPVHREGHRRRDRGRVQGEREQQEQGLADLVPPAPPDRPPSQRQPQRRDARVRQEERLPVHLGRRRRRRGRHRRTTPSRSRAGSGSSFGSTSTGGPGAWPTGSRRPIRTLTARSTSARSGRAACATHGASRSTG